MLPVSELVCTFVIRTFTVLVALTHAATIATPVSIEAFSGVTITISPAVAPVMVNEISSSAAAAVAATVTAIVPLATSVKAVPPVPTAALVDVVTVVAVTAPVTVPVMGPINPLVDVNGPLK